MEPRTRYIYRPEGRLAYQVLEGGSAGYVIYFNEMPSHLDLVWTDASIDEALRDGVRSGVTAILLQSRGIGLSDPVSRPATVEEQAADLLAVMDAEDIGSATLGGAYSTCLPVALIAAQHPERVTGLVLDSPILSAPRAGAPYPGYSAELAATFVEAYEGVKAQWGNGGWLPLWDPGLVTVANMRLAAMLERCVASPEMAHAVIDHWLGFDGRDIFPQVRVPTRVVCSPNHAIIPETAVLAVVEAIPDAEYHELPVAVPGDSIGSTWAPIIRHCIEMALGAGASHATRDRVLASVLFTDIVGSTERLAEVGDSAWKSVLADLERLTRREVTAADGRMVHSTGDGALCELAGPAAAVRCAQAIRDGAPVPIRAGIHTGECERRGDNLAGLAVHIGARVCAAAAPGEVLVSRTVRDLMAGSELAFASRGVHDLKGVPGSWELYAAGEEVPAGALLDAAHPTPTDRLVVGIARRAPGALRTAGRLTSSVQRRRLARRA